MDNERDNGYSAGDSNGPGRNTDNREPVVVAEQPATPVESEPNDRGTSGQEAGPAVKPAENDGWSSPMDTPPREDAWSGEDDNPYLGSTWNPPSSGVPRDRSQGNGASGTDSSPVYQPAPPSYGVGQPGGGQGGSGNSSMGGSGRNSGGNGSMGNTGQNSGGNGSTGSMGQNGGRNGQPESGRPGYVQSGSGNSQQGSSQYQTQYQTQYEPYQSVSPEKNNLALASLVMGILALPSICCCMFLGIIFGVLGIVFAIMSKSGGKMDGQAKAGLILSIIAIVVSVLVVIFFVALEMFSILPGFGE